MQPYKSDKAGQAATLAAATRLYRAWEAENMLDGAEPSPAGPHAVERLMSGLLSLFGPKANSPLLKKHPDSKPAR